MGVRQSYSTSIFSLLKAQASDLPSLLREEIVPSVQDSFRSAYSSPWLLLAVIIGVGIRGYYLSQPMRFDESVAFLEFVNGNLQSLFYYPYPNNHVLHTILVKLVTLVLGANPISIRLIAFLAGIACIPLVYSVCRQLNQVGIFAALSVSVFPFLISYSTNARGYTLLVLLTLLMTLLGLYLIKRPSIAGAALMALVASLGMLTMPSMLFPIAGLYLWVVLSLFINTKDLRIAFYKFIIPCGVFTAIFTLILYTPVIIASQGIETIVNNIYVKPQAWSVFFEQLYPHIRNTLSDFLRDIPGFLRVSSLILVLIGMFSYIKKRDHVSLLLLPSLLLGSAVVLLLQHKIPFARTWIFIIPFLILAADAGFTLIIEYFSPGMRRSITLLTSLAALIFAIRLMASNNIAMYPDTGIFSEASIAAKYLKSTITKQQQNLVFESKTPATYPIYFYLWYYDIPIKFSDSNSAHSDIIYIVKKSSYSLKDMTDQPVNRIFAIDDMEVFQGVNSEQ